MAGYLIVMTLLMIFATMIGVGVNYVLDSAFLISVALRKEDGLHLRCCVPFYGQYLMGKMAGIAWMGAFVAVCHILTVLMVISASMELPMAISDAVDFWFTKVLLLGFLGKECIVQTLIRNRVGKWKWLILCANLMTMGIPRSILLYALRKRLDLPLGETTE